MNNPYNNMFQQMETAAASGHGSAKLAKAALLASILSGGVTAGGNLADLFLGDTNAINSGELFYNMGLGLLPSAGSAIGLGLGSINKGEAGIVEALAKNKSASGQEMKEELKNLMKEKGPEAAQAEVARRKNMSENDVIDAVKGGRFNRRMAGAGIGALLGAGTALGSMVDDSY